MTAGPAGKPGRRLAADLSAFTSVALLGFFFRTFRIWDVPSGLTWDEGAEGLEAARLFHGQFPLFFPEHGGHEPLLVYLQAGFLKALGWNAWALRLPTAFLTTLALAGSFIVARRLFGSRVAWLSAWLQACTLWQVALGRMAIRPASLILFGALTMYWLVRWLRRDRPWPSAALCGLFAGVALYTYTAARFLPLAVAAAAGAAWLRRPRKRELALEALACAAVAGAVASPLAVYFSQHPGAFSERVAELSILQPSVGSPWLAWLRGAGAAALMFSVAGETGWDKNIAHRPMFDPAISALAAAGLVLALWRWRRANCALTVLWLAVMTLPLTLTAKDLPDFGRVSGIAPAVFFLPAIAAAEVWRRKPALRWLMPAGACAVAAAGYWQYFAIWADSPERAQVYRPGVLAAAESVAGQLLAPGAPRLVYFGAFEPYDAVTDFVVAGFGIEHPGLASRLIPYDARYTRVLPPPGAASYLVENGAPPLTALPDPVSRLAVDLEGRLTLDGYDLPEQAAPGETLLFRLRWHPETTGGNVTLFAHLLDYSQRQNVAGFDHNGFPPQAWHGGESVLAEFPIGLPAALEPGAYWLEAGAYTDGSRRLTTGAGADRLVLGPVIVAPRNAPSAEPVAHLELGVSLLPSSIRREGNSVNVALAWLPGRRLDESYSVFVHLLDPAGRLVAQSDGLPAGGRWPTTAWRPGIRVPDQHHLTLPAGLPAGLYRVTAGLYVPATGQRLAATPTGPEPGSVLVGDVSLG